MSDKKSPSSVPPPPPAEDEIKFGDELAILPIRNAVLFPGAVAPFDVGRAKSVALVEEVHAQTNPVIAIFAQRDPATDDPTADDLYPVGCAARVLKALKHSSGNYSLILQGLTRIRLDSLTQTSPYMRARITRVETPNTEDVEAAALALSRRALAQRVRQRPPQPPRAAGSPTDSPQAPGAPAAPAGANLAARAAEKAPLSERVDVKQRVPKVVRLLTR